MKKIKLSIILALLFIFSGCDSYLDRQPDDPLNVDNIFLKYETTLQYLINVYSWLPDESDPSGQVLSVAGSSDECSISFTGRFFGLYNRNMISPETGNSAYRSYTYINLYTGIREATYFMQNLYKYPEKNLEDITNKKIWYAEARFIRAYYYFLIMRFYGPVILLGDEIVDFKSDDLADRDRAPWDVCVNWVSDELDAAAEDLPVTQNSTWWGRATQGAAMAVKARLLLYSARPLFNGNSLYKNMKNKDGEALFSQNEEESKWQQAAKASKDIIDLDRYSLINNDKVTPLENIRNVFTTRYNSELIFTSERSAYKARVVSTPSNIGGTSYGGVAPTQKLVDAFAMNNGRYPITGYTNNGAVPVIDPNSGYSETGFSNYTNPFFNKEINTFRMYQNREPRFYANIFWSGQTWIAENKTITNIQFYTGGVSGPSNTQNYSPTGYLPLKFIDTKLNTIDGQWGNISYPLFRYGEVLLNYVEALNEYDPNNSDILKYWNEIRLRAGVPKIEEVYPEIVGNKSLQRDYIRRERQVELCFENLRYFDTRTWMTSEKDDDGPVYGMNISNTNHDADGAFWKRTVVPSEGGYPGVRIFAKKKYLLPINQGELDRVKNITQNYGY